MFGALRSYFHSELVLPANPVDHIPARHTSMTQPSEHTSKDISNKKLTAKATKQLSDAHDMNPVI